MTWETEVAYVLGRLLACYADQRHWPAEPWNEYFVALSRFTVPEVAIGCNTAWRAFSECYPMPGQLAQHIVDSTPRPMLPNPHAEMILNEVMQ